jgi:F420 biosynthesis protein FbiB-like protein
MDYIMDSIRKRRSIRKYSSRQVSPEIIKDILEAAQWAPSAHNAQPWRFIVITGASVKRELSEAMANAWKADMTNDGVPSEARENLSKASVQRFTSAPALMIACLTMKDMVDFADEPRRKSERDLAVQSLGAAIQNMLLAAYANGLGACWFCAPAFCKETVRKILKIPEDVEPQALITVGYPAERPQAPPRKPLKTYAYSDCWGKKL